MSNNHKRFTALAVPALLGLGLMGAAMSAGQAGTGDGPVRCEIQTSATNGMIALEGMVYADAAISGSYKFRVVSAGGGGRSNIQQGGAFTAGPGGAVSLGRVMLGGAGASYDASLSITSNGATIECAERVAI